MRRLSEKQRRHFWRKSVWGSLPRRASQRGQRFQGQSIARLRARSEFEKRTRALPPVKSRVLTDERLNLITPPRIFSLADNYEETLAFLMELRRTRAGKRRGGTNKNLTRRWRTYLEFDKIERIGPAAGLVLAAEIDAFRTSREGLKSLDNYWHENVRDFFTDSGLFDLLGIKPQNAQVKQPIGPATRVLKYRRGSQPDGQQADELRTHLEAMCGEKFGPRIEVNNALCEAMTNAHHHAYPASQEWWPGQPPGSWWATGAWTPETRTMHMILYDQGVGIPATLPRSSHWLATIPILDRLDPERTDAGLIEAALELRRTSTNIAGRGRGLFEMAEWIDQTHAGFLRILSGKGAVIFRPGQKVERINLPVPFQGTLVEWEVRHGE